MFVLFDQKLIDFKEDFISVKNKASPIICNYLNHLPCTALIVEMML